MFGHFGKSEEEAKRSEFFVWFHLKETDRQSRNNMLTLTFRPESNQFNGLVAVQLTFDGEANMQAVALRIRRAFIDHDQISTFAADITKSFLLAALNQQDLEMVREAVVQIRQYQPAGSHVQTLRFKDVPSKELAPGEGEPEYLAYAGIRRQFERQLKTVKIDIANESVDGSEQLTIIVRPK